MAEVNAIGELLLRMSTDKTAGELQKQLQEQKMGTWGTVIAVIAVLLAYATSIELIKPFVTSETLQILKFLLVPLAGTLFRSAAFRSFFEGAWLLGCCSSNSSQAVNEEMHRIPEKGLQISHLSELDPHLHAEANEPSENKENAGLTHRKARSRRQDVPESDRKEDADSDGEVDLDASEKELQTDPDPRSRRGWRFVGSTLNEVCKMFDGARRVYVIGPFKVGKSTMVGWLDDKPRELGDQVANTKGLAFHEGNIDGKHAVTTDTEGFHQPLPDEAVDGPYSPAMAEDFIIDFMGRTADFVILMMDRVSTQDIPVLNRIVRWSQTGRNRHAKLVVVHNVKTILTPQKLRDYMTTLQRTFGLQRGRDNTPWTLYKFTGNKDDKHQGSILHHFVGNFKSMPTETASVIAELKASIAACHPAQLQFAACLQDSVLSVLGKYYVPKVSNTKNELSVRFTDGESIHVVGFHNLSRRAGIVGSKLDSKIDVRWFVPEMPPKSFRAPGSSVDEESKELNNATEYRCLDMHDRMFKKRKTPKSDPEEVPYSDISHLSLVWLVIDTGGVRAEGITVTVEENGVMLRISKLLAEFQNMETYTEEVELPFVVSKQEMDVLFAQDNIVFDDHNHILTLPIVIGTDKEDFLGAVERIQKYG